MTGFCGAGDIGGAAGEAGVAAAVAAAGTGGASRDLASAVARPSAN